MNNADSQTQDDLSAIDSLRSHLIHAQKGEPYLTQYFSEKRRLRAVAPALIEFIEVITMYLAERLTDSDKARTYGYAHAGSVLESARIAERWAAHLSLCLSKVPLAQQHFAVIEEAAIVGYGGITKHEKAKEYASIAINIARNFSNAAAKNKDPADFLDLYGDALQPPVCPWDPHSYPYPPIKL